MTTNEALQVLEIIRRTNDTTQLDSQRFSALCEAVCFYLKRSMSLEQVAKLAIEEIW